MRGRPIVQWILFALMWGGLLYPIAIVTTSGGGPASKAAGPSEAAGESTWITIRFSSPPSRFLIRHEDRVVWEELNPAGDLFEKAVGLVPSEHGIEIEMESRFSSTSAVAAEVTLEPSGWRPVSRTVWLTGLADEAIVFDWSKRD